MKKIIFLILAIVLSVNTAIGQQQPKKKVFVYVIDEHNNHHYRLLRAGIIEAFANSNDYTIIEINEKILTQSNFRDERIPILKRAGADYVCVVTIYTHISGHNYIRSNLIDTENALVIKSSIIRSSLDNGSKTLRVSNKTVAQLTGTNSSFFKFLNPFKNSKS